MRRAVSPAAPFIVGSEGDFVLDINRESMALMPAPARLEVVPNASHLFAEPGALEEAARLTVDRFRTRLPEAR